MGIEAGQSNQGQDCIAIGYFAQRSMLPNTFNSIAIGASAGSTAQGSFALAIGQQAGLESQGDLTVAVGAYAGQSYQGSQSVAIGYEAGAIYQATFAGLGGGVAIGSWAGHSSQRDLSVAVGYEAGRVDQAGIAVAVGGVAGHINQPARTIAINATGLPLNPVFNDSFYVTPIRNVPGPFTLFYDPATGEITYN